MDVDRSQVFSITHKGKSLGEKGDKKKHFFCREENDAKVAKFLLQQLIPAIISSCNFSFKVYQFSGLLPTEYGLSNPLVDNCLNFIITGSLIFKDICRWYVTPVRPCVPIY